MGSLLSKFVAIHDERPTQDRHKDQKRRAPERMSISKLSEDEEARILIAEGAEYIRSALAKLEMEMSMPSTDAGAYQDQKKRGKSPRRGPSNCGRTHSRPSNHRDGPRSDDGDEIPMLMSGGGVQARANAFSGSIDTSTSSNRHGPEREDRQDYYYNRGEEGFQARRAMNPRNVNFREAHSSIPPPVYSQTGPYPSFSASSNANYHRNTRRGRTRMDNLRGVQRSFNVAKHTRMRRDDQGGMDSQQADSGSSTSYTDVDEQDEEGEDGTEQQEGEGSTNVSSEGNINRARRDPRFRHHHHPPFPDQGPTFGSGDGSTSPAPTRSRPSGLVRPPLSHARSSLVGGVRPRLTRDASAMSARMKGMPTTGLYDPDDGKGRGRGPGRSRLRKEGRTPPLRGRRFEPRRAKDDLARAAGENTARGGASSA